MKKCKKGQMIKCKNDFMHEWMIDCYLVWLRGIRKNRPKLAVLAWRTDQHTGQHRQKPTIKEITFQFPLSPPFLLAALDVQRDPLLIGLEDGSSRSTFARVFPRLSRDPRKASPDHHQLSLLRSRGYVNCFHFNLSWKCFLSFHPYPQLRWTMLHGQPR